MPFHLPAMDDAAAQPLRFLDFLIHKPERSIVLYGGGIPVLVPAPERYCIYKMIISERRRDGTASDKARKDLQQASLLLEAAGEAKLLTDLGHAWLEAWDRGPKWRKALAKAERRMDEAPKEALSEARHAAGREADRDLAGLAADLAAALETRQVAAKGALATRCAATVSACESGSTG